MASGCRKEARAQKNQNWGYFKAKCLAEIWTNEEIQQQLSAIGRKRNIWQNIAKTNATTMKQHKLYKLMEETCLNLTSDVNNAITNMFRQNTQVYSNQVLALT